MLTSPQYKDTLLQMKNDMTLKPQERRAHRAGPLPKKRPPRVPNGRSLEPCKAQGRQNNHHHKPPRPHHQHQHSDQENNPRLAHSYGKKKKKKYFGDLELTDQKMKAHFRAISDRKSTRLNSSH